MDARKELFGYRDFPARRRFMKLTGAWCASLVFMGKAGALPKPANSRTLSFVHTHTGETLRARYFESGQYCADSLGQVSYLLRDFRTGDIRSIDPSLLDILFDLQVMADRHAPFEVISGYRSPATNAMLRRGSDGVAPHSMHLLGRAIDVRLQGYSTAKVAQFARTMGRGGVGLYPSSDFVHVDTGRVRFW